MSAGLRVAAAGLLIVVLTCTGCAKIWHGGTHSARSSGPSSSASSAASATQSPTNPRTNAPATTTVPTGTVLQRWTVENLTTAFKTINDKIGANPAEYVEITINSLKVMVMAINPRKRENVDEYDYDGTAIETLPVNLGGGGSAGIEESAFESDTVKPAVLAQVMGSAINDSGVENGDISSVLVDNTFEDSSAPIIEVNVSNPRVSKSARYDLAGQLQQVV